MKKTLSLFSTLLLCLFINNLANSQTVSTAYATQINATFANLDKSRIPHKLLVDYAMEFAELSGYNGVITNENIVNRGQYTSIYNTLLMSRVNTNVAGLVSPTTFRTNWENLRQPNKIVLSGLYYKYNEFKPDAPNNTITITNGKLYDKFVNGVWQNPYNEKQVFAMASPIIKFNKLAMQVQLPSSLWYTNQVSTVQSIAIDFSDGLGYQTTSFGQIKNVSYTASGLKEWKYKLTLTNGQILYSHSKIFIDGQVAPNTPTTAQQRTINQPCSVNEFGIDVVEFTGSRAYAGQVGNAILEIDYRNTFGCGTITNPLIIVEGFDSGLQGVENPLGEADYFSFRNESDFDTGLLANQLNTYDIIYINFKKGSDDLHRNAYLVEDVIKWVNSVKVGTIPNVVIGQSMGGLLARFALRDMENQYNATGNSTWQHQTNLYVSHDAPHQGANIPLSILAFARHMIDQFVSTPLGDFNINISGEGAPVTIEDMQTLLNATGTKQLLINNLEGTFSVNNNVGNAWRTELKNLGYPQLTRNISLSNASHCAFTQPFSPLDNLFTLTGSGQTGVLTDFLLNYLPIVSISTYTSLAILFNEPALLIGILPGNSKFNLNFYGKALPPSGGTNRIYNGNISFTKTLFKLFGWTPRITVNITNKGYDAPAIPSYDYFPGGSYNSFITSSNSNSNPDFSFLGSYGINLTALPSFNFIPATSALDIGNGSVTLSDTDYLKKYVANVPLTAPRTTPFINYTTSFNNNGNNEQHISFNRRNGNWLATELDTNPNNNDTFSCLNFCSDAKITGSDYLCGSGVYNVTNEANPVNTIWSITEGNNLVNFTTNGNQITLNQTNQSGYVTISVVYGNDRCGTTTTPVLKRIWVGTPQYVSQPIANGYDNVPINSTSTLNVQPVPGAQEYYWWLVEISNTCGCTTNSDGLTLCPSGTIKPKFTANNSTSSYTSTSTSVNINWGNCAGNYVLNCASKNPCGLTGINYKAVNVYSTSGVGGGGENPCEGQLAIYPNPVNESNYSTGEFEVNIIYPGDPCDDYPEFPGRNGNVNQVKIYDFYGNLVHSQEYNSDQMKISDINLKRGNYILNVFTSKGFSKREIIVVK